MHVRGGVQTRGWVTRCVQKVFVGGPGEPGWGAGRSPVAAVTATNITAINITYPVIYPVIYPRDLPRDLIS